MAKRLDITLAFSANTQQAKAQMQQLQTQLTALTTGGNIGKRLGITEEIQQGINAAAQLKIQLQAATNANTGKLDLGKFNQQLKQSGMTVGQLATRLKALGPEGNQAFMSLARSVANAELPLVRVSSALRSLGQTLANTVKWQISSSLITGVISTFSSALRYSKELNSSLNQIRIVTSQSLEDMDKFATRANKIAKQLGTSTNDYVKASLIFYQQGLNDKEVEERTNATIKLANVTKQTAQEVSEWLTSIWNNFDNGSKSLEYYADVLTALGAATASSADEIAGGLEKFAAIADTVGLSYEAAASALATITAQTRQSEDVVGTALKTIFARIQDLDLGKTLEDGTTLGQYSESLYKVGINIKDASGQLKDMDIVLSEMGNTWKNLEKDQQVALAKGVAGIRQYNQVIALMDNWDFYEQNKLIAESSSGTLNQQQEIYAESWEAASQRVQTALESIYSTIMDDDAFISLLNGTEDFITFIDELIESIGGLPGLLTVISTLMFKIFGTQMASGIKNMSGFFMSFTKAGREKNWNTQQQMQNAVEGAGTGELNETQAGAYKREIEIQRELYNNKDKISQLDMQIFQTRANGIKQLDDENIKLANQIDLLSRKNTMLETDLMTLPGADGKLLKQKDVKTLSEGARKAGEKLGETQFKHDSLNRFLDSKGDLNYEAYKKSLGKAGEALKDNTEIEKHYKNAVKETATALGNAKAEVRNFMGANTELTGEQQANLRAQIENSRQRQYSNKQLEEGRRLTGEMTDTLKKNIKDVNAMSMTYADAFVSMAGGISQFAMGMQMAIGAFSQLIDMFKNGEFSVSKFLSVLVSLGMGFPMVLNGFKALKGVLLTDIVVTESDSAAKLKNTVLTVAQEAAQNEANKEHAEAAILIGLQDKKLHQLNEEELKALGIQKVKQGKGKRKGKRKVEHYENSAGQRFRHTMTGKEYMSQNNMEIPSGSTNTNVPVQGAGKGAAKGAGKGAAKGAGKGAAKGLSSFAKVAIPIAVTVAIAAGAIALMNNAINKHNKLAEKAAKNAQMLKAEYQKATQATQDFQQNVEKFDELNKKTNSLVKGTVEYQQALLNANEAAMELISSSERLKEAGAYSVIDGRIVINEQAIKEATQEKIDAQQEAFIVSQQSNLRAQQAQQDANEINTLRDVKQGFGNGDFNEKAYWGVGGGLAAGISGAIVAGLVNAWNPVGWITLAIGGIVAAGSAIYGQVVGDATERENEALAYLQEQYEDNPNILADEAALKRALEEGGFGELSDSFADNIDSIRDLIISNDNLRIQNEALGRQIAATIGENEKYKQKDERYQEAANEIIYQEMNTDEIEETKSSIYNKINSADNLLGNFAKVLDKDAKYSEWAGWDVKIERKEGDEWKSEQIDQDTIAWNFVDEIARIAAEGNEDELRELRAAINNASYLNETEKKDLIDLIGNLEIEAKFNTAMDQVYTSMKPLQQSEYFSSENQSATFSTIAKQVAQAQATGSNDKIDFSFMSREQLAELENHLFEFDVETRQIIAEGIQEYETKRAEAILSSSIDFDSYTNDSEKLQSILTKNNITMQDYTAYYQHLADAFGYEEEFAKEIARINLAAQAGINSLVKTFKDYEDAINKGQGLEFSKAISALQTNFKDWFGVEIDSETTIQYLDQFKKAVNGDITAIKELYKLAQQKIIVSLDLDFDTQNDLDKFIAEAQKTEIKIGMILDTTEAYKELGEFINNSIKAGLMTAEGAERLIESMGFIVEAGDWSDYTLKGIEADTYFKNLGIDTSTIEAKNKDTTIQVLDLSKISYGGSTQDQLVDYMSVEAEKEKKNKTKEIKDMKESIERYHRLNVEIDKVTRSLDRLSKAADRAYGQNKLKLLDKQIEETKKLKDLNEQLLAETEQYIPEDKANFQNALSKVGGGSIQYDSEGNVLNWESIQRQAVKWVEGQGNSDEAKDAYAELEKYYEQYADTIDKRIDLKQTLEDQVYEIQDLNFEKIQYKIDLRVELNEMDMEEIEETIKLLGDDLFVRVEVVEQLERYWDPDPDDPNDKSIFERSMDGSITSKDELDKAYNNGNGDISEADYIEGLKAIRDEAKNTVDTMLEVKEKMSTYYSDTLEQGYEEFQKYYDFMSHGVEILEHYSNILDIAGEEENYWKKGDLLDGILDTREKQLEANTAYFEEMQEQVAKQELDVTKAQAALEAAEAEGNKEKIKAAEEALKLQEGEYEAALAMQNEAELAMLESAEEYAQALRDIYENEVAKARRQLELAMTGGVGFDYINASLERANALTEEWYDDTNKIYETNKMLRNIQNEIDKTTNIAAKQKLQTFQAQTKELQNQRKLSKVELDIQQKRYDLLLAEIALEESRNAKNQVRLQRDSEGNFGYVYTANQQDISNAEQSVEDAKNVLYNLTIDSTKKYTELYYQVLQEYYDALADLEDKRSTMTAEEYERQLNELNIHYNNILSDYIYLGQVSFLAEDTRLSQEFKDGWEKTYNDIMSDADGSLSKQSELWMTFMTTVGEQNGLFNQGIADSALGLQTALTGENGYINTVKGAYEEFGNKLSLINNKLGIELIGGEQGQKGLSQKFNDVEGDIQSLYDKAKESENSDNGLKTLQKAIQDNADEATKFSEKLVGENGEGGLVKDLGSLYDAVDAVTTRFGTTYFNKFTEIVGKYEAIRDAVQTTLKALGEEPSKVKQPGSPKLPNTSTTTTTTRPGFFPMMFQNFTPSEEKEKSTIKLYQYNKKGKDSYEGSGIGDGYGEDYTDDEGVIWHWFWNRDENGRETSEGAWFSSKWVGFTRNGNDISYTGYFSDGKSTKELIGHEPVEKIQSAGMSTNTANIPSNAKTIRYNGETYVFIYNDVDGETELWIKKSDIRDNKVWPGDDLWTPIYKSLDTGGYTGTWGPEGRWAMLHQKEIVLNAHDTENFLAGINILRDITKAIDLQAMSYNGLINNYLPYLQNTNTNTLQQDVTIHAEFPNATDHNEIQLAIEGLVNSAAQRANRK